ncbi:uncharacterized protein N7482_008152 [Penicillium canariense]|uniref:Uncharacterized protein n=1 Tax=Penicillium canariense TaxID=189055 RepID=A0A9W9HTD8_9EURO|nr:uncharacterized protein N7482_008152 [Penicillium canariense]KAJ5157052.1 hypothetical protein N7482_008152 [Penicillium canariense]
MLVRKSISWHDIRPVVLVLPMECALAGSAVRHPAASPPPPLNPSSSVIPARVTVSEDSERSLSRSHGDPQSRVLGAATSKLRQSTAWLHR